MTTQDKLPPLAERIASIHHDMLDGFEFNTNEAQSYVTEELSRVVEMAHATDALIRQQEARIAELEAKLADANDELSHWRRLAIAARDALGRSGGLCGMEREQLTASQIIKRLADMPATEVELAETSLGIARQNREDLAKFRELAREAFNAKEIAEACGGVMSSIEHRLAALHTDPASSPAPQTPPRPS